MSEALERLIYLEPEYFYCMVARWESRSSPGVEFEEGAKINKLNELLM